MSGTSWTSNEILKKRLKMLGSRLGEVRQQANNNLLSFPYGGRCKSVNELMKMPIKFKLRLFEPGQIRENPRARSIPAPVRAKISPNPSDLRRRESRANASGPLALAEYRHPPAVGVKAVDIELVRTDHPIDVDQALVAALRGNLLG